MEDKTFELLTQLYKEFSEFRKETNSRFDKLELSIENDIKPDIKATLDGYKQLAEGQEEIKDQLSDLKAKVTNQEVEITVLKAVK